VVAEDSLLNRAIEVWVLNSLAVAQPLFAILGPNPPFFAAHRMSGADVALLLVVVLGTIPVAALLIEVLAGWVGPRAQRWVHAVICGILVAFVARPLLDRLSDGHESVALAGALGSAVLFVSLHLRWATGRELMRFLAPAPLVFVAVFLWSESVRSVVAPPEHRATIETAGDTPIVFLILDELPLSVLLDDDRQIDASLFPAFARLASRSIWFRNATAKHTLTTVAVPALLSGRSAGGLRFQRAPDNVFSWLAGSHRLIAREHVTSLCPPDACEAIAVDAGSDPTVLLRDLAVVYGHWALPRSLVARTLPPVEAQWADFSNRVNPLERENLVRSFISSIENDRRPTFYFLHVLLPHVPWAGLPSGKVYPAHFSVVRGNRSADEWPATIAFQRHLLQVGYVDRLVGALLDRLDATGLFDRTLVVVTSDHGVAFEPGHHRRDLDDVNLRDVVHVPLFVKPPHLADGWISDRNVESIDVLPTMADAAGMPLPFAVEGQSALDSTVPPRPEKRAFSRGRTWTFDATLPSTWAGLRRKTVLFGRHPTWDDVWALSSAPELMAMPVDVPASDERPSVSYAILDAEEFDDVAPTGTEIPTYLRGIVWAADRSMLPDEIAVAVEGVVRGVGRLFDLHDSTIAYPSVVTDPNATGAFAMMLPERAFRAGTNHVEAFAVGAGRRLWRMRPGTPPRLSAGAAAWPDT